MIYYHLFDLIEKDNNDKLSKHYLIFDFLMYQILIFDMHIFEMNQEKDNLMVILYKYHDTKMNNQM